MRLDLVSTDAHVRLGSEAGFGDANANVGTKDAAWATLERGDQLRGEGRGDASLIGRVRRPVANLTVEPFVLRLAPRLGFEVLRVRCPDPFCGLVHLANI